MWALRAFIEILLPWSWKMISILLIIGGTGYVIEYIYFSLFPGPAWVKILFEVPVLLFLAGCVLGRPQNSGEVFKILRGSLVVWGAFAVSAGAVVGAALIIALAFK